VHDFHIANAMTTMQKHYNLCNFSHGQKC